MREHGELGPSWHHQQQRQRLEATLNQGQLPARLEALARFDNEATAPVAGAGAAAHAAQLARVRAPVGEALASVAVLKEAAQRLADLHGPAETAPNWPGWSRRSHKAAAIERKLQQGTQCWRTASEGPGRRQRAWGLGLWQPQPRPRARSPNRCWS
jgi:hypothetical protein